MEPVVTAGDSMHVRVSACLKRYALRISHRRLVHRLNLNAPASGG